MKMSTKSKVQISKFREEHLFQAKDILDSQFGYDYLTICDIKKYLDINSLGLVAIDGDTVLGLTLIKLGTLREIKNHFLKGKNWFKSRFIDLEPIALRKHLAVLPGMEGKGIGKELVVNGMKILEKHARSIISIVWEESAGKSVGKILRSCGSMPIHTLENYWSMESIEKQYLCPNCKKPPCRCSATIYAKIIDKKPKRKENTIPPHHNDSILQ